MRKFPPISDLLPSGATGEALIVKPSSLGDIVHTLPAVAWLHQAWPDMRWHWLVNTEWKSLLEGAPFLASVIDFPRGEFRGLMGWRRAHGWMRGFRSAMSVHRFRLAIDFQGLLRSAWLARQSGAAAVIGPGDAREGARFFYHVCVPPTDADGGVRHSVERYLGLVRALGPGVDESPALAGDWLPAGDPVPDLTASRFIVVHPFARGAGKSLGWTAVLRLAKAWDGHPMVVVGRTDDPPPASLPPPVVNLVNATTLLQLVTILRHAAVVVSADSGPMHLASALRRPLVGIHTWSDPRSVGPYDPLAWIWKGGRLVRRTEIDPSLAACHREPTPGDLDEIAGLVRREFFP